MINQQNFHIRISWNSVFEVRELILNYKINEVKCLLNNFQTEKKNTFLIPCIQANNTLFILKTVKSKSWNEIFRKEWGKIFPCPKCG